MNLLNKPQPKNLSKGKASKGPLYDSDSDSDVPLPIRKSRSKAPPRRPALYELKWLRVVIGEPGLNPVCSLPRRGAEYQEPQDTSC